MDNRRSVTIRSNDVGEGPARWGLGRSRGGAQVVRSRAARQAGAEGLEVGLLAGPGAAERRWAFGGPEGTEFRNLAGMQQRAQLGRDLRVGNFLNIHTNRAAA